MGQFRGCKCVDSDARVSHVLCLHGVHDLAPYVGFMCLVSPRSPRLTLLSSSAASDVTIIAVSPSSPPLHIIT